MHVARPAGRCLVWEAEKDVNIMIEKTEKMKCHDCIHLEVCKDIDDGIQMCCTGYKGCKLFKPKTRYIELPCAVGQTVYYISFGKVYKGKCHAITLKPTLQIHLYDFDGDNASYSAKDVFPTKDEAEQVLKGKSENE